MPVASAHIDTRRSAMFQQENGAAGRPLRPSEMADLTPITSAVSATRNLLYEVEFRKFRAIRTRRDKGASKAHLF